ncbi:MAG: NADP-dependent malic enzyme [Candidatus Obscuribacterales bacterium]|nr:NADP-dependent malic enzyme [Candidatus Obscuribacterales bacterium]
MEEAVNALDGINIRHVSDAVELAHLGGKLQVSGKRPITNLADLAISYTPGVAKVCKAIAADPEKAHNLTIKRNTVAVVSDGSRVLALGNIGPYAAMPVMEGKAQLFRQFGGVDAFPICLDTQDPEEIIRTVKLIAPAFGGINLEDIASPECYEIERRLQAELDIPVLHDDQHGTAIAVLAATINAVKLVRKHMSKLKIVASGVGAAGLACSKMLLAAGVKNLIGFNKGGAVYAGREGLSSEEQWLAANSNPHGFKGTMQEALVDADMFLGLSVPGVIKAEDLKPMRRDPIVFALANPVPEVDPEAAAKYARVIATGGSNFPNQINNALVFPGLFRGALDCRVRQITEEMKLAAARALADVIKPADRDDDHIIPNVFDTKVAAAVAGAVVKVAIDRGLARRIPKG